MARSVELALGNLGEAIRDTHKAYKAKAIGARIDANLIADDTADWAKDQAQAMRNRVTNGRYAVSDALDDVDFAIFNDNAKARLATAVTVASSLAVGTVVAAGLKIRKRLTR